VLRRSLKQYLTIETKAKPISKKKNESSQESVTSVPMNIYGDVYGGKDFNRCFKSIVKKRSD